MALFAESHNPDDIDLPFIHGKLSELQSKDYVTASWIWDSANVGSVCRFLNHECFDSFETARVCFK